VRSAEGWSADGTKGRPDDTREHIRAALRNGACRPTDSCPACVPSGGVVAIIDGDSLTVMKAGEAEEIRLYGIDGLRDEKSNRCVAGIMAQYHTTFPRRNLWMLSLTIPSGIAFICCRQWPQRLQ